MATNTFVILNLPDAADLADLTGVRFDLETARQFAQKLMEMLSSSPPDYSIVDPFSTAILVRYSRPFVTGVRKPLREQSLTILSDDQRSKHEYLRALRDKHIAHSVNCLEESTPVARYWVERVHSEGIVSVSCNHQMVIGLSTYDLAAVIELTNVFIKFVDEQICEEEKKLLAIVRAMPLDQVLAGGMGPTLPCKGPVDRRRKR